MCMEWGVLPHVFDQLPAGAKAEMKIFWGWRGQMQAARMATPQTEPS